MIITLPAEVESRISAAGRHGRREDHLELHAVGAGDLERQRLAARRALEFDAGNGRLRSLERDHRGIVLLAPAQHPGAINRVRRHPLGCFPTPQFRIHRYRRTSTVGRVYPILSGSVKAVSRGNSANLALFRRPALSTIQLDACGQQTLPSRNAVALFTLFRLLR
jgi:hypothetical protein